MGGKEAAVTRKPPNKPARASKNAPLRHAIPRTLTREEQALWKRVVQDVEPVLQAHPPSRYDMAALLTRATSNKPVTATPLPEPQKEPEKQKVRTSSPELKRFAPDAYRQKPSGAVSALQSQPRQSKFEAGDPRAERHVRRGRRDIDATLDLHGMTQIVAHERLKAFIKMARLNQSHCVLVITGKGGDPLQRQKALYTERFTGGLEAASNAPRGVLRERFLDWVEQPPLTHQIARVAKAKPADGGSGAFYVFLKKKRSPSQS